MNTTRTLRAVALTALTLLSVIGFDSWLYVHEAGAIGATTCTVTASGTTPTAAGYDPQTYTLACTGTDTTNDIAVTDALGDGLWATFEATASTYFGPSMTVTYDGAGSSSVSNGYGGNTFELDVTSSDPNTPPNDTIECNLSTCDHYEGDPAFTFSGDTGTTTTTAPTTTTTAPTTTTTGTGTTTEPAYQLIADSGDGVAPGFMALAAGILVIMPLLGLILHWIQRLFTGS